MVMAAGVEKLNIVRRSSLVIYINRSKAWGDFRNQRVGSSTPDYGLWHTDDSRF